MLYHFCCSCSAKEIRRQGDVLRPMIPWARLDVELRRAGLPITHLAAAPAVVWLTTLAQPDVEALGLTSQTLKCDRTEWRFTVGVHEAEPWFAFAMRHRANPKWRRVIEEFGRPETWFVATRALAAREPLRRPFPGDPPSLRPASSL